MIKEFWKFLWKTALNGFLAIPAAAFLHLIFCLLFILLMVPVGIIWGDGMVENLAPLFDKYCNYQIVYTVTILWLSIRTLQGKKNLDIKLERKCGNGIQRITIKG